MQTCKLDDISASGLRADKLLHDALASYIPVVKQFREKLEDAIAMKAGATVVVAKFAKAQEPNNPLHSMNDDLQMAKRSCKKLLAKAS